MRAFLMGILLIAAAAGAGAVLFSAFIVDQTHKAIVLQFGEPVQVITEPGLYWRKPFVQTVEQFDKRILDLETDEQEVIASDQKRLVVDAFARYRILDPLQFYQAFRTEAGARPALDRDCRFDDPHRPWAGHLHRCRPQQAGSADEGDEGARQ